jgi:molecular chaperone GrpE
VDADDLAGLSVTELKDKVRRAREDAQRNWQHFLHSAADLENYKKQAARDRLDAVERSRRQMLSLVLSVVDNLERALAFGDAPDTTAGAGGGGSARALLDGLRMTHRQILEQLAAVGVRPIETIGKPFDPRLHEAVSVVSSQHPGHAPGTVVGEALRGYLLNDEVLRPAKVAVAAERTGGKAEPHAGRKTAGEQGT